MSMITLEVDIREIEAAIKRLKPEDKIRLVENLERQTWPDRLRALLHRIDQKAAKYPIPEEEIKRACETIRHGKRNAHRGN